MREKNKSAYVSPEVLKSLATVKVNAGYKSINEVIEMLLGMYNQKQEILKMASNVNKSLIKK